MRNFRRNELIQRIQRLPDEKLDQLEKFLTALERGDFLSPLFTSLADSAKLRVSHNDTQPLESGNELPHSKIESGNELPHSKDWPHSPLHRICERGTYIVTAGAYQKEHFFRGPERLELLESTLLRAAKSHGWQLEAWAVFSNHYHFVAHSQIGCTKLDEFLKQLHGETAVELNKFDTEIGRQVWHNYWDTELTFEKSYLARLNYVHQNAVKHGLVAIANQYRYCSAAWFERTATPAQVKTIYSFKIDKVRVVDEFEPI